MKSWYWRRYLAAMKKVRSARKAENARILKERARGARKAAMRARRVLKYLSNAVKSSERVYNYWKKKCPRYVRYWYRNRACKNRKKYWRKF